MPFLTKRYIIIIDNKIKYESNSETQIYEAAKTLARSINFNSFVIYDTELDIIMEEFIDDDKKLNPNG